MKFYNLIIIFIILLQSLPIGKQQDSVDYPVYVVSEGDTLTSIAQRFGISTQDLIIANNLTNPNVLPIGTQLLIPSLPGVSGILSASTIPFGYRLYDLSRIYSIPVKSIARINRLTSPNEAYAGAPLIIPVQDLGNRLFRAAFISDGQSLIEQSILLNQNSWTIKRNNNIHSEGDLVSGDLIYSNQISESLVSLFSPIITDLSIEPLPLVQGETSVIRVSSKEELSLKANLNEDQLNFSTNPGELDYISLVGISRNSVPGLVNILISGTNADGDEFSIQQSVLIRNGYFRKSPPLSVDPETIDPANTAPEEDFVRGFTMNFTPERYWTGRFTPPTLEPDCITAWYGDERIYNQTYTSFHTGVDYGVCVTPSLNIFAPAPGTVVFSGSLIVRGNATIIDHGWGVYSGMWHQKESFVSTGDFVDQGQLIGLIGDTGRVSGPHLHWELWVGGNQVNPTTWLQSIFP